MASVKDLQSLPGVCATPDASTKVSAATTAADCTASNYPILCALHTKHRPSSCLVYTCTWILDCSQKTLF